MVYFKCSLYISRNKIIVHTLTQLSAEDFIADTEPVFNAHSQPRADFNNRSRTETGFPKQKSRFDADPLLGGKVKVETGLESVELQLARREEPLGGSGGGLEGGLLGLLEGVEGGLDGLLLLRSLESSLVTG